MNKKKKSGNRRKNNKNYNKSKSTSGTPPNTLEELITAEVPTDKTEEEVPTKQDEITETNNEKDDHNRTADWEGQIERRIFQELYASHPHGGRNVEAGMFPILFPTGDGVFDQDRQHQPTFAEYRDHLLNQYDPRFREDAYWKEWADSIAAAIAARRRGENVILQPYSDAEIKHEMEQRMRTTPMEERTMDPFRIRNALLAMQRINPAYQDMNGNGQGGGMDIEKIIQEKLVEARQWDGNIIKECAVCYRYECPEDPELKLSKCAKCFHVYYCSREHQLEHWPIHKKKCRHLAKLR